MNDAIELPYWWKPWQRRKNTVIYQAVRLGLWLARTLPFFVLLSIAVPAAALGFVFAVKERRRAVAQIRRAMPELRSPAWTVFRMFVHLGRIAAEFPKIDRYTRIGSRHVVFTDETKRVLDEARAEGRGILCVSPHLGNWELYAQTAAAHGYKCATVAKRAYDPRITELISSFRTRAGLVVFWRGDPEMLDKLRGRLASNDFLGVLIDQDTRTPSVFVPFFGRPASTPVIPAWLAVQQRSAVLFGYAAREGSRYRIHFERVPMPPPPTEPEYFEGLAQATALTAELTARTEAAIRRHPEQWMWLHERWKRQP